MAAALPGRTPSNDLPGVFAFGKPSARVYPVVFPVGHFGDPGTGRRSFWRLPTGSNVGTISIDVGIRAFIRSSWTPEFFGGERSDASPPRAWNQPSGSGRQCASQPPLLPRIFAVPCFCHGTDIAFCHSRSRSAQQCTTPFVCGVMCVCACVCAVCVRACEYRIRRRSTTQKRGSPRFRDVKGPLKRADGPFQAGNPAKRFVRFSIPWPCV